ncbi:hypothetical protein [Burkholderia aenigmatica]|uniref:hypothetical protein n=1 Tax=Burkholderia aenigmatica TaxID=2015348 RepID=UPI00264EC674|nr:hypothetical protein [Burkholderia aenigmatica]MDN7874623.1 hypothetical protein [Burkholderia aenigmatica]
MDAAAATSKHENIAISSDMHDAFTELDVDKPGDFYPAVFERFEKFILRESPVNTADITRVVKRFFFNCFASKYDVLYSGENNAEYLADVLVTTFRPKEVISRDKNMTCEINEFRSVLAVESEIGGVGASSAWPLMRNVVEDYLKLLFIRCKYRVMIFTSLPYVVESGDYIKNRANTMREIYSRTDGVTGGALLIHLAGANNRGTSAQVKVTILPGTIRGFVISEDGRTIDEIPIAAAEGIGPLSHN